MNNEIILSSLIDEISMGPFGSDIKVDNFIPSGIPVLNGSNLSDKKLSENSFNYVSKEKADSLGKANAKRGDIVITHRGTLGQVSYIPQNSKYDRYIISQSQFRVRFKESINPVYLTYLFHTKYGQKKLLSFKSHVGVPALAQATTNFKLLNLQLHNKAEQDKIASFLCALDDKIELNNKINTELDAMAKTLYNYWFVQFDFPNKKGKPYKSSGGKMVYNDVLKTSIPEGWETKALRDFVTIKKGTLITEKTANANGKIKVASAGIDFSYYHSESNFDANTITISASGANAGFINFWREPIFACDCTTVRGQRDIETIYTLFYLKSVQEYLYNQARGSAQPHVYPKDIEQLNIVIPAKSLFDVFEELITPLNDKISNHLQQNQELAELRDCLLPMLMNGQVKVGNMKLEDQNNAELIIPDNKKAFAKQALAGKIISTFKNDPHFTHIKFQKLQYLAEHIIETDLYWNYYFQTAGPYDNKFMHTISDKLKQAQWFEEKGRKFIPLKNENKIDGYYQELFHPVAERLSKLFLLLAKSTEAESEIIATLYAVWNNRIILKQPISDELIIEDFYNWSGRKKQYSSEQLHKGLKFLRANNFVPNGFGKEIKRAKDK